ASRAGMSLTSTPWSAAKQAASPLSLFGLTVRPGWAATAMREGTESAIAGGLTWGARDGIENLSGLQHHTWRGVLEGAAVGGGLNLLVGGVAGGLSGARVVGPLTHRGRVVMTKLIGRPLINGPSTAFVSRSTSFGWPVAGTPPPDVVAVSAPGGGPPA